MRSFVNPSAVAPARTIAVLHAAYLTSSGLGTLFGGDRRTRATTSTWHIGDAGAEGWFECGRTGPDEVWTQAPLVHGPLCGVVGRTAALLFGASGGNSLAPPEISLSNNDTEQQQA